MKRGWGGSYSTAARSRFKVDPSISDELAPHARTILLELAAAVPGRAQREAFLRQARTQVPGLPRPGVTPPLPGGLARREREVAARIAHGESNRASVAALVPGERTVEKHVENILLKLGFQSRAQIAAWAVAQGLGPAPPQ
jgi:DNA-binding NarL/FixJ family response regulator